MIKELAKRVKEGHQVTKEEALGLVTADLEELSREADGIRHHFCGNAFDLCAIINGKSGRCSEDCVYCAQSVHGKGTVATYPFCGKEVICRDAVHHFEQGVERYSVVTSGRKLTTQELTKACESYSEVKRLCGISLCASHGLLSYEEFVRLKKAGVSRYHNNLETSRRYFPFICTTHTYDEKLATLQLARKAGLELCSGGIMGLGEAMEDRIDMAMELRRLEVKSIPINILNPIPGTVLEHRPVLSMEEVRRIVGIYRFLLPDGALRMAGGRGLLQDQGKSLFCGGANAAITGDMLTTAGISIEKDVAMVKKLGYEVRA